MPYAFVGASSHNKGSAGASDTVTRSPVAGNGLFVVVAYQNTSAAIAMLASGSHGLKDQSNNDIPYIECGTGYWSSGSGGYAFHFLFVPNIAAGITSITATIASAASAGIGIGVAEYSGLASVVDGQNHNDGQSAANTSANTVTSNTITPTGATAGAILIGFCGSFSAFETATAGTGFTNRTGTGWVIPAQGGLEDKRITSNSAVAATFTAIVTGHVYSTYAFVVDEAAASGAIAGTADITFGQSGTLSGAGSLAASAAVTFGQAGALKGLGALAGSSAITFGTSATLAGAGALSASAAVTFGANGTLAASGALVGSSAILFDATGTLTAPSGAISGTAGFSFGASGALTGSGALSASAAVVFGTSGVLQASGALVGLAGIIFDASATPVPPGALAGTASISFDGTATISASGTLAGLAGIAFDATGTLQQPFQAVQPAPAVGLLPGDLGESELGKGLGPHRRPGQVFGEPDPISPYLTSSSSAIVQAEPLAAPIRLEEEARPDLSDAILLMMAMLDE